MLAAQVAAWATCASMQCSQSLRGVGPHRKISRPAHIPKTADLCAHRPARAYTQSRGPCNFLPSQLSTTHSTTIYALLTFEHNTQHKHCKDLEKHSVKSSILSLLHIGLRKALHWLTVS